MLFAAGWAVVRSSLAAFDACAEAGETPSEALYDASEVSDAKLYADLREFLQEFSAPELDWHFRESMNNETGLLTFTSSRNHRGLRPAVVVLFDWLAEHGQGSHGLAYIHDDEDSADIVNFSEGEGWNEYQALRLMRGQVESLRDPFFSPIIPRVRPAGA